MKLANRVAVAVGSALVACMAQAAPITCGGPSGTRTVTVDPALACVATGLTNLGDGAIEAAAGATLIERDLVNSNGGSLNITGVAASSGTWSFVPSALSPGADVYLYFHFGNGNPADPTFNPDWFLVKLVSGVSSGTWSVNPTQLTLSNIALLGTPGNSVPEPGTLALLGIGLAGLAISRRRKQ